MQPATDNSILQDSFLGSQYFNPAYLFNKGYVFFQHLFSAIFSPQVIHIYYGILFILSTFFLAIIFYSLIRVLEIRKKEHAYLEYEIAEYAHHQKEREEKAKQNVGDSTNARWRKTLTYLFSESSSDWKLAIIEADAMLDSLLDQLGFRGATLADKLKSAGQDNFRNLALAWEGHTARNRIAHEGLSYEISQHEAKRVIALYETIFRSYGYI